MSINRYNTTEINDQIKRDNILFKYSLGCLALVILLGYLIFGYFKIENTKTTLKENQEYRYKACAKYYFKSGRVFLKCKEY